jgi:hypothetical protein
MGEAYCDHCIKRSSEIQILGFRGSKLSRFSALDAYVLIPIATTFYQIQLHSGLDGVSERPRDAYKKLLQLALMKRSGPVPSDVTILREPVKRVPA